MEQLIERLPSFGIGWVVLAIVVACALFMIVRGALRLVLSVGVLCVSAWIAFRIWQRSPTWVIEWTGDANHWLITALPILGFVAVWWILRTVVRVLFSPLVKREAQGGASWSKRIGSVCIAALALALTALVLIHHLAAVDELRHFANAANSDDRFLVRMKRSIEETVPAAVLRWLDPLSDPSRLELAKYVASQKEFPPVIDPVTGRPYPRAIVVDDEQLEELVRERRFSTILRHPKLDRAMDDPQVVRWFESLREEREK